jgi:hypothetical protein
LEHRKRNAWGEPVQGKGKRGLRPNCATEPAEVKPAADLAGQSPGTLRKIACSTGTERGFAKCLARRAA